MEIIAEITINSTQGQFIYQILRTDPALETHYTIVMLSPEPKEIAEADWDDEVLLEEVLEDLNLAEIELDETIEIDIEDQNNKEIKN